LKAEVEEDFDKVALWAASNSLKLNANKTSFIVFRGRNMAAPSVNLTLDGQQVAPRSTVKILGVIFDEAMTFAEHANHVSRKVTAFLGMLASRRKKIPRATLVLLVNAYVSSQLVYCLAALSVSSVICTKFQLLQNYAIRVIYGLGKFSHCTYLRRHLGWLSIEQLGKTRLGMFAHRAIHNRDPSYLAFSLSDHQPQHTHGTRSNDLRLPFARNNYAMMTFESRCLLLYNRSRRKEIWADGFNAFMSKLSVEIQNE
jgi:hypothetical protein